MNIYLKAPKYKLVFILLITPILLIPFLAVFSSWNPPRFPGINSPISQIPFSGELLVQLKYLIEILIQFLRVFAFH